MTTVSADVILAKLREFCDQYDTYGKAAKALKVTPAQLSQTLNKKNNVIPERILKRLGFKSEMVYSTIAPKKPNKRLPKKPTRRTTTPEQRAAMRQARSGVNAVEKRTMPDTASLARHGVPETNERFTYAQKMTPAAGKPKDEVIDISIRD